MPDSSLQHTRTFDENLDILFDEIVLAAQWERPSLLLAVHRSKIGQVKAEKSLQARLEAGGFRVVRFSINDKRSDIAALIQEAEPSAKTVFFFSNIDWGGGADGRDAFRALNLHRELFVEQAIKAVFWLSTNEAANLPRFSPDFWAFRHRVVEFVSQRATGKVQLPAGILAWDIERTPDPFESAEDGIRGREELLRRLPDSNEALSSRADIHAGIGFLYWTTGALKSAAEWFEAGMALAKDYELPEVKASLLNGMGAIDYENGQLEEALSKFTEGLRYRSSSRVLLINTSATQAVLGRVQDGLNAGKKAIQASPADADTWRRYGYIQNATGRPDEAIACLAKAIQLRPNSEEMRLSLAALYGVVDRPDDARAQLNRARELRGGGHSEYASILEAALAGEGTRAQELLDEALKAGKMARHHVQRDLNLGLLMEPEELGQALSGLEE